MPTCMYDTTVKRMSQHDFWKRFVFQALQPPRPPIPSEVDPKLAPPPEKDDGSQDVPSHIVDAMGRSMLLHHVAASLGPAPVDATGAVRQQEQLTTEQKACVRRM